MWPASTSGGGVASMILRAFGHATSCVEPACRAADPGDPRLAPRFLSAKVRKRCEIPRGLLNESPCAIKILRREKSQRHRVMLRCAASDVRSGCWSSWYDVVADYCLRI